MILNIYAVGSAKGIRYYVDHPEGRLHILNERSLVWNLKKVFGVPTEDVKCAVDMIKESGAVRLTVHAAA